MRLPRLSSLAAWTLGALLASGAGFLSAPVALAQDGPEGEGKGDDTEAQIKAQMEKILQLMRENEKALLQASAAGGGTPKGVEVVPPPGEQTDPKSGASPSEGATPPKAGGEGAKKLDEVIRSTQVRGGTIPGELETLVKLIPT